MNISYGDGSAGSAVAAGIQAIASEQKNLLEQLIARKYQNDSDIEASRASANATKEQYMEDATATKNSAIGSFVGAGAGALCLTGSAYSLSSTGATDTITANEQNNVEINNNGGTPEGGQAGEVNQRAETNRQKNNVDGALQGKLGMWNNLSSVLNSSASQTGAYLGSNHTQTAGGDAANAKMWDGMDTLFQQNASGNTSFLSTLLSEIDGKCNQILTIASYNAQ